MATAVLPMPVGPVITISVFLFIVFWGSQRVNRFGIIELSKFRIIEISRAKDYRLNFFNFFNSLTSKKISLTS